MLIALTVKSYEFIIIETDKPGLLIKIAPGLAKLVKNSEYRSFTETAPSIKLRPTGSTSNIPFIPNNKKKHPLERLYKPPAMPQMVSELILLKNDNNADTAD